jgi:chaperonin GroES
MRKDVLASGARKATFVIGADIDAPVELKNLSSEPRMETEQVEIDRTRKVRRIVPQGDNLLVERRESEDVSAGGILIPQDTQDKDRPAEGVITAVGPGVKSLSAGQRVLLGRYSGVEYPFGGQVLLFVREDEVIAIVEE